MPSFLTPYPGIDQDYDILILDTEFVRLPLPTEALNEWAERTKTLSVALAALEADDPDSFYAVREQDPVLLEICPAFVHREVLPHLEAATPTARYQHETQLQQQLADYLAQRQRRDGKPPVYAVDWPGDAHLLEALLPAEPLALLLDELPEVADAMTQFFSTGDYRRHNALHDALAIRQGLQAHLHRITTHTSQNGTA